MKDSRRVIHPSCDGQKGADYLRAPASYSKFKGFMCRPNLYTKGTLVELMEGQ
jgi:hypothetical protein